VESRNYKEEPEQPAQGSGRYAAGTASLATRVTRQRTPSNWPCRAIKRAVKEGVKNRRTRRTRTIAGAQNTYQDGGVMPTGGCFGASQAPTASRGAYAKLGRRKGTEHQEFYLNYSGSEVVVQSMTTITESRTSVQMPIQIWWASACQVPDLRKCLRAKVPFESACPNAFPENNSVPVRCLLRFSPARSGLAPPRRFAHI
jgi:hypothetical protein